MGIGAAMNHVAGFASINLDGRVLVHKRTLLVGVARKANFILGGGRTHLLWPDRSVDIVAVAALNQSFVYSMVERHRKLRSLVQMAGVTKLGLSLDEQKFFRFGVMRRMARNATHVVLGMFRIDGVHMLGATGVASQTAGVNFLRRAIFKDEDLGDVTASRHVSRSGTVTTLASLMRRAALRIQCCLPVRTLLPSVVNILMTGLAYFRPNVIGRNIS